jgi:mannose/fructose/N-acetylgalactosamine-specific phosphotransferase system component IIC
MKEIVTEPKIIIGFCLVMIGWGLPLLMVMQYIQPTFLLCFIAYAASFSGIVLGFIGTASAVSYLRLRKRDYARKMMEKDMESRENHPDF